MIAPLADHLWQSTVVAVVVGLLAAALRRNRPEVRYRLWLAASLKFLVPLAAVTAIASRLAAWAGVRSAAVGSAPYAAVVDQWDALGQPFSRPGLAAAPPALSAVVASFLPMVLLAVWLCGCVAIVVTWVVRWRQVASAVRSAPALETGREVECLRRLEPVLGIGRPIRIVSSAATVEPGAFGIWRPVLLWPRSIAAHFDDAQAEAILAHEAMHVARRDNLAAALHMLVQALFWFHPLVWWIGTRLVDERERACDAEVVRLGSDPRVYAESILKTCQFYVESPLVCVSGVTGSDLKTRIEQIMKNESGAPLNAWRRLLLVAVGGLAIAVPLVAGVLSAARLRAQSSTAPDDSLGPPFANVSIEANASDGLKSYPWVIERGRFAAKNVSLRSLVTYAYQIKDGRISGGPPWTFGRDADRFDIEAEADGNPSKAQMRAMVRRFLADTFNLVAHRETREQPIYGLLLARGDGALGPRLRTSACSGKTPPPPGPYDPARPIALPCGSARALRGSLEARWLTLDELADFLALNVGKAVRNRTGLGGHFDLDANWTPDTRPPGPQAVGIGPATFTAIEEQLGLRLVEETGPVETFVIDRLEKPVQP